MVLPGPCPMNRGCAMIHADQRWIGDHGIGRFARHVLAELSYSLVSLSSNPASPLDSWRLTRALGTLTRNDLFFSPGYNPLALFCAAPFIYTCHHLNHIDRPVNSSLMKRLYYATVLKRACHRAARILTVSEFSRARASSIGLGYRLKRSSTSAAEWTVRIIHRLPTTNFRSLISFVSATANPQE